MPSSVCTQARRRAPLWKAFTPGFEKPAEEIPWGRRKPRGKHKQSLHGVQRLQPVVPPEGLTSSLSGTQTCLTPVDVARTFPKKTGFNLFTLFFFLVLMTTNCLQCSQIVQLIFLLGKACFKMWFLFKALYNTFLPKALFSGYILNHLKMCSL